MSKHIVIFLLSFLFLNDLNAQKQQESVLLFSDEVQTTLYNHIKDIKDKRWQYYARISFFGQDTIQINLCKYDSLNKHFSDTKLINATSTKIRIKTIELPLLNEIDFMFSNFVKHVSEDGTIIEDNYPRGGFFVVFNIYHDEKIIRTGFER